MGFLVVLNFFLVQKYVFRSKKFSLIPISSINEKQLQTKYENSSYFQKKQIFLHCLIVIILSQYCQDNIVMLVVTTIL